MRPKLLMTTAALSVVLGATGFAVAQDRGNADTQRDQTIQSQDRTQPNRANPNASSNERGTTGQAPSSSTSAPANQSQTTPSQTPNAPANANSQNQPATQNNAVGNQPTGSQSTSSQPGSGQTNQPASAQSTQPSATQPKPPAAAQTETPKQPQPSTASGNQNNRPATAQQPTSGQGTANQAAAPQNNVRISASLQAEQKTRLQQAVAKLDLKPVNNVNFSISVGTAVPRTVSLRPVPTTIVSIVPQYRGYNYFVVRDEIVIVEPSTHRIVDVIERSGPARAQATTTQLKLNLTTKQKEVIRKHSTRRTTSTTTGSAPRSQSRVIVGEEAPDTVMIESFPEEVYREVPEIRSYRYIRGDRGIYIVEPQGRRVIEEFD